MPLLLPPAPRQAGRACSASCVLFSYSCKNRFDLMTAESFAHFCCCNIWHQAGPAPFPRVCVVLILLILVIAVRSALWTMMAELCFSVNDFILDFFSNTAADTASEYDSYGHRRCWTAAASCPYYSRPAPRQAGRACSASCVLLSYSCKNLSLIHI